jgi:hypothetical protein
MKNIFRGLILFLGYVVGIIYSNQVSASGYEKLQNFTQWFAKNQGFLNGIEVHQFPDMGNGFRATKSIQENDLVIKVPNHLIFSLENMRNHPNQVLRLFTEAFQDQSNDNALIAWIVYEKYLGPKSFFYEYVEILPQSVPNLQFFTDEEIHELQNKNYEQEILSFQQDMHENYQKFLQALYSLFQKKKSNLSSSIIELFLPKDFVYHENEAIDANFPITKEFQLSDIANKVTYKDYQWALSIVNSRALRFHGEAHLIPMADIFNYEKHDKSRQNDNGNFFLQFHQKDPNTKAISIFADRYTETNAQLFEDYGDNTNEIYLQYHGFIPHTMNPFHCIKYDFSSFFSALSKRKESSSSDEEKDPSISLPVEKVLTEKQFELLKLFKFPLTHMQSICLRNDGKMNRNHFVFFAILAFNEQEMEICSAAFQQQQQQQSSSSASRVNWMKIFRDCSFERVFQYYEDQLTIATNTLADPRQRKQKRKEVKEVEEGEEEENKNEPEKSLEVRLWEMIQFFLQSTSNSLSYPTTVEEDRNLLLSIQQWKRSFLPDNNDHDQGMPSMESMIHRELAIKYRVTNKLLYQHLCDLYDLDCSQGMFQADFSGEERENKQEKPSEVSSTATEVEEEEEAIDENVNPVTTATLRKKIADFNSWFRSYHPEPCLIEAHLFDNFYRVGTIVTADKIAKEDLYLGVPDDVIMSAEKAFITPGISKLVSQLFEKYKRNDEFHELAFFLIHETMMKKEESFYHPYLSLLPTYHDMKNNLAIFWDAADIRRRLSPSHTTIELLNYQRTVQRRFKFLSNITEIASFFTVRPSSNKKSTTTNYFTHNNYLWATAILDSRSIWWEGKRHLVPMLDFINCAENTDVNRLHSTTLDASKKYAITKSGDDYKRGEQLFENYGQPNHIYFQYHGFILPENSHDCVHYHFFLENEEYERLVKDGMQSYLEVIFLVCEVYSFAFPNLIFFSCYLKTDRLFST